MNPVYLQKFCITVVSDFSWVLQTSQEKSKTMVMQNFFFGGGGGKTRCITVYVRIVDSLGPVRESNPGAARTLSDNHAT